MMSRLFHAESFYQAGVALFSAAEAGGDQTLVTVQSLVTSSLMGHDSHGVMRIPEYPGFVEDGLIDRNAETTVTRTIPAVRSITLWTMS